jgi:hypothetical protein
MATVTKGGLTMRRTKELVISVGVALACWVAAPAYGASSHAGKVVEAGAGKLTMTNPQGEKQHTHDIPTDAAITCGGKKCALEDVKAEAVVTITMDKKGEQMVVTAVSVE